MIAESESWVGTVNLAITTIGGLGVAWITLQQLKAKRQLDASTRKIETAARVQADAAKAMETSVGELTKLAGSGGTTIFPKPAPRAKELE